MKTYIITSERFKGEIEFRYNDIGQLTGYDNRAEFDAKQHEWMLGNIPVILPRLQTMANMIPGKVTELKIEITFEMFWKQYFAGRGKDNSSRKRAQTKWERMSLGDRAKAYGYINRYLGNVRYGTVPKHAETYLNSELWNE